MALVQPRNNNSFRITELEPLPKEWKIVRLGEVIEIFDKQRIPLSEEERADRKGPYPYCGANGVIDYIDDYLFDGEYVLLAEDGGYWGPFENSAYIMRGKFWVNNHAHIIRGVPGRLLNDYLLYFLIFMDIQRFISGTTRGKLTQGVMKALPILLPSLPEQRAIAYVLRTVQRAKEATERVIAATRELKKSLMRHLFTYGPVPLDQADQVPLKETEIGPVPEHWEVVRLGEVAYKPQYGYTASAVERPLGPKFLRITDIQDEQHKIARILRAVDRKIEAEENCKAALEALFKTLLHHLMTGKVRVPLERSKPSVDGTDGS